MSGGGTPWGDGGGDSGATGPQVVLGDVVPADRRAEYEADINTYLEDVIRDFSQRDTEAIGTHIETLRQALEKDAESPIQLRFGGSIKKHTYVDGLSDVDEIVPINGSGLESKTPKQVIHDFAEKIRARLPYSEVSEGNMAVTVQFTDGQKVQVLPAIRTPTGIRVSDQGGQRWSNVTNPDRFANKLTSLNQETGGKLVRVIRLFKAQVNPALTTDQLSGYHVEALAVDAFTNYNGRTTYKDMLIHLTEHAASGVLHPMKDTTGQSSHVDDDLGPENSFSRRLVASKLQKTAKEMKNADSVSSLTRWKELIG